ncbi:MAG TPA: glycosyltransferase [Catalimonadaceae bacterium]|nr:glycosyltransferase [Catalimonadaceae bacterium]
MYFNNDWALVIPMANEASEFQDLVQVLKFVMDKLETGKIYFIVDRASKDNTLELCQNLSVKDPRFETVWAPENRNVVDAYLKGYQMALQNKHKFILEMDAGLSHDPRAIPMFLRVLNEGNECAFGSRNINGGSNADSPFRRRFISTFGTVLANFFLGTRMSDMTSGFQGFHANVVRAFLDYGLKSKAHFYQTELRYLLRYTRYMEVPIHYRAPSPSVSKNAISDSLKVFWFYIRKHRFGKAASIKTNFNYHL